MCVCVCGLGVAGVGNGGLNARELERERLCVSFEGDSDGSQVLHDRRTDGITVNFCLSRLSGSMQQT